MIIVPKVRYILLTLSASTGIIVPGIWGYRYLSVYSKEKSESLLFLSIILSVIFLVFMFHILVKSKNITREMEELIHLSSIGGFSPRASLKSFGKLGDQISRLYYHLSLMNKKRSLKIGSQKFLLDFIVNNFSSSLLVTDAAGTILYASSIFAEKKSLHKTGVIEKNITVFFPEMDIQILLKGLEATHTVTEYEGGKEAVKIYPVKNEENEISYLVFLFGRQTLSFSEKGNDREGKMHNFLKRFSSK